MFYKSSILAAIFVLLSMGNAIASELSQIESFIAEQQSKPAPKIQPATAQNSASIAKARLLKTPIQEQESANPLVIETFSDKNSASTAKARLRNLSIKETPTFDGLEISQQDTIGASQAFANSISAINTQDQIKNITPHQIVSAAQITSASPNSFITDTNDLNQTIEQHQIASTSSELSAIEQWEVNKSVSLTDILLPSDPVLTIVQAPDRLPDNPAPSTISTPPKPAIIKSPAPITKKTEAPNSEPKKWAVGVHAQLSTTGFVGVDAGYKFSPNLHARLGLNTVGFNVDYSSQGIDYKAKFNPTNVHLLGDYFPFGGGLRLTGGLVFQSNQFNGTGTPNGLAVPGGTSAQISLGGVNYNLSDVGTVTSEGSFSNSVAPYLGIGFGTPISPGLGFNFEAGVMFAGSPNVKLRANVPSSVPAILQDQIRASLADQERRTNNDISSFSVYPVVSVGFSYAF